MQPAWSRNLQLPHQGWRNQSLQLLGTRAVKPEDGESDVGPAELTFPSASLSAVPWGGKGGQLIPQAVPAVPSLTSWSSPGSWPSSRCHSIPPAQGTQAQGLGINPSSGHHKRADLGSHPSVLLEPCGRVTFPCPCITLLRSHSQTLIFSCAKQAGHCSGPQTSCLCPLWDWSYLRGPQCQPPALGPALGGQWSAGRHSWDLGSSEPALRGGGRGVLDTPAGAGVSHGIYPQPSLHLHHLCPPAPVPGPVGAALTLSPGNVSLHNHPSMTRTPLTVTPV